MRFSELTIRVVRIFILLDKLDIQKKLVIMGWSLKNVSYNLYKAAFCLSYLNSWTFNNSSKQQTKRLFILCVIGISTVDFGFYHIE